MRAPDVIFARQGSDRPDPIFAAIRAVRAAQIGHTEAVTAMTLHGEDDAALHCSNAACDRHDQALGQLVKIHPTTWAGFCELIDLYAEEAPLYGYADTIFHLRRIVERRRSQEGFALGFGSAT